MLVGVCVRVWIWMFGCWCLSSLSRVFVLSGDCVGVCGSLCFEFCL